MSASFLEAESILAIDLGNVSTRAILFDVASEQYRFIASGTAPSTAGAPFKDIGEGVRVAIERLQQVTGRTLVGSDERLIMPALANGSGVDKLVITYSVGPALQVSIVGLLDEVSLESAHKLAAAIGGQVREVIGLNDRRSTSMQVDAIIKSRPDLVILAGGTDGGASRSMLKMVDTLGLAFYLLPLAKRPEVLFAGNKELQGKIEAQLERLVTIHSALNIRPSFDVEDLSPAMDTAGQVITTIRSKQIGGMIDLANQANGHILPAGQAFGRMIRFLSMLLANKSVLGVDIGAAESMLAAAHNGKLDLFLTRAAGMGQSIGGVLSRLQVESIACWLAVPSSEETVRDYLYNKLTHPANVPVTVEELAIEQALARYMLRQLVQQAAPVIPAFAGASELGLSQVYDPILAGGAVLAQAPTPGEALLMLLDGLQPQRISTILIDQNHLTAALGVAAQVQPALPVQVFESGAYLNLGTLIAPVVGARPGTPVVRLRVSNGEDTLGEYEVKYGTIQIIPVPRGQTATVQVEALHRADVGFGRPGRGGKIRVTGGLLGLIVDGRGRPIQLPPESGRRREMLRKWLAAVGG